MSLCTYRDFSSLDELKWSTHGYRSYYFPSRMLNCSSTLAEPKHLGKPCRWRSCSSNNNRSALHLQLGNLSPLQRSFAPRTWTLYAAENCFTGGWKSSGKSLIFWWSRHRFCLYHKPALQVGSGCCFLALFCRVLPVNTTPGPSHSDLEPISVIGNTERGDQVYQYENTFPSVEEDLLNWLTHLC